MSLGAIRQRRPVKRGGGHEPVYLGFAIVFGSQILSTHILLSYAYKSAPQNLKRLNYIKCQTDYNN